MSPGLAWAAVDDRRARLARAAAAIASARPGGPDAETAWQDGLDLLAVIAGMKPVCLLGRGPVDAGWIAALCRVAAAASLPVAEGAAWQPLAPSGVLPDWYLAASAARNAARPVIYVCRDEAVRREVAVHSGRGRIAVAAEAALLAYPPCCVAQHHAQALGLERLILALCERVAPGEDERKARMIAHGAEPLPATAPEWERHLSLTAVAPARSTSVNMCDACAGDDASAASLMSRRYDALAALAEYPGIAPLPRDAACATSRSERISPISSSRAS